MSQLLIHTEMWALFVMQNVHTFTHNMQEIAHRYTDSIQNLFVACAA